MKTEKKKCECGCKFLLHIEREKGFLEKESYRCPECGKEYKVLASLTPKVMKPE